MPMPLAITRFNQRYLNKAMVHLVGHLCIVELEHVGRRSRQVRRTPIMAFRRGDQVTIALTYGPRVQWLKNVTAAGGARMRFGSGWVRLGAPTRLDEASALARMPQPQRMLLAGPVRCHDYVSLPVLAAEPEEDPT